MEAVTSVVVISTDYYAEWHIERGSTNFVTNKMTALISRGILFCDAVYQVVPAFGPVSVFSNMRFEICFRFFN